MPVTAKYRLCALQLGTVTIGQIVDESATEALSPFLAIDSASGQERAIAADLIDIRFSATTQAVKTALATIGLTGLDLASNNAVLYFAKYDIGGNIDADGCVTFTIAKGMAIWRSISAGEGQAATAVIEIIAASADGIASPCVRATAVAVPTVATAEIYALSTPVGVKSIEIDTGINPVVERADADLYNTFVAADPARPRVRYTLADVGAFGVVTNVNSIALVDVPHASARGVAPITFTFAQSFAHATRIGGSPVGTEYELIPTYNGTNAPIVITGLV